MVIKNQSVAGSVFSPTATRMELLQVLVNSGRHSQRELASILHQSIQNWCDILEVSALQVHLVTDTSTLPLVDSAFSSLTGRVKYLSYAATFSSALSSRESSKLYCVLASASRTHLVDDMNWLRYQFWSQNPQLYAESQLSALAQLDQMEAVESGEDSLLMGGVVRVAQKTRYYPPCRIWLPLSPNDLKPQGKSTSEEPLKRQWPPLYTEMDREGFFLGLTMFHQVEQEADEKDLVQIQVFESDLRNESVRSDFTGVVEQKLNQVVEERCLLQANQIELFLGVRSLTIGTILATGLRQRLLLGGIYVLNSSVLLCCGQALGELLRLRTKGMTQVLFELSGQDKLSWVVISDIER